MVFISCRRKLVNLRSDRAWFISSFDITISCTYHESHSSQITLDLNISEGDEIFYPRFRGFDFVFFDVQEKKLEMSVEKLHLQLVVKLLHDEGRIL